MKKIIIFAKLIIVIFISNSCVKKTTTPKTGSAIVHFTNKVDLNDVSLDGVLRYTNAYGNKYSVTLLRYYISHAILINDKNDSISLGNISLIDEDRTDKRGFTFTTLPAGNYTKLVFNLGVPYDRNHTGLQDGDLDPQMDMIWDWATGYIFMKHEGKYTDSNGVDQSLRFHYGTDKSLISNITLPITMKIDGNSPTIFVDFNLNKVYQTSNMNFNVDNNHQSNLSSDADWLSAMHTGLASAFSINKIQ